MAKLSRIHLAGMGNLAARFNPVTLDFRNSEGVPAHTLIWLRNGGGKTTLLSLVYSTLLPKKLDWLGKHNGKPTELADYLPERQLGYILIEFAFGDGTRRVVGQSIVKRGPRELSQVFFTFRSDGPLPFEKIPVLGLGVPPVPTREAFFDALETMNRQEPARFDFYKFDRGQHSIAEWYRHLAQLGIDPGVYKSHLVMNSDEGGLGEFFDFPTSDSFVLKLLEMADDPLVLPDDEEGRDITTEAIDRFRRKALECPNLACEMRLCRRLQTGLEGIHARLARQKAAAEELRSSRKAAAQLLFSVERFLAELAGRISSADDERLAANIDMATHQRAVENLREYARSYDRIRKRCRATEADQACKERQGAYASAEGDLRVLRAAQKLQALREQETRVAEYRRRLEDLLMEKRPELEELRKLGGALHNALTLLRESILGQKAENAKRTAALRKAAENAEERLRAITRELMTAEHVRDTARTALNEADASRRRLREKGIIGPDENPAESLDRVLRETQVATGDRQRHNDDRARLLREANEARARAETLRQQADGIEKKGAELAMRIAHLKTEAAALCENPILRRHAEGTPDLYNPGLIVALDSDCHDLDGLIQRSSVEGAADERLLKLHSPPGAPLFPPPPGVERVLGLLKAQGVSSAISGYQWLNGTTPLGEAMSRLAHNPAIYAGVIIQNPADWPKASQIAGLEGIDLPVVLAPLASLGAEGEPKHASVHVIVPRDAGYFNAAVAAADRALVENRAKQRHAEVSDLRTQRDSASRASAVLRDFVARCPAEMIPRQMQELSQIHQQTAERRAASDAENVRATTTAAQAEAELACELTARETIQRLESARQELDRHKREHADKMEESRRRELSAIADKETLTREEEGAKESRDKARDEEQSLVDLLVGLVEEELKARQRLDGVPEDYVDPAAKPARDMLVEQMEIQFTAARKAYEGSITQTGLKERIEEAEGERKQRAEAYRHAAQGLDPAMVETAATYDPIDHEIQKQEKLTEIAKTALDLAGNERALARNDLPPELGRDQRETINPDWPKPETAAAAAERKDQCDRDAVVAQERVDKARDRINKLDKSLTEMRTLLGIHSRIKPKMAELVADIVPSEPHPDFRGRDSDDNLAEKLRKEVEAQRGRHEQAKNETNQAFSEGIAGVLSAAEFADQHFDVAARFRSFSQQDIENRIEALSSDLEKRATVLEHDIAALDRDRANVVVALAQRAQDAADLLRSAANLSTMPEGTGVWAGYRFLKITLPQKGDDAERKTHLGRLLDYWVASKENLPAGARLAHACLLGSMGSLKGNGEPQPNDTIEVEMLKPEATRRLFYHPIIMMKSFSGGELVTAAIILYCILARMRAQRRGSDSALLAKDAGFLLLDNPVGKANLPDFLDLQIQTADILGVQYVCGTGINDPDAIGAFPKVIRLRNSALNPRTNANLVQVVREQEDHTVEAAHLAVAANTPARVSNGNGTPA